MKKMDSTKHPLDRQERRGEADSVRQDIYIERRNVLKTKYFKGVDFST
jgi:hypothetical protein